MSRRVFVPIAFIIVVIVVIGVGYQNITSSADGSISPVVAKPDTTDNATPRIPVTNQYASFTYPAKFTPLGSEKPVSPVLTIYNYRKQQVGSWQINIQITRLDTNKLADDGSYNYRNVTPSRFDKEVRRIGSHNATIFDDKTDPTFNKVGYIQQGSLAASFSMSGGTSGNYNQLQTDFDALIASWTWR